MCSHLCTQSEIGKYSLRLCKHVCTHKLITHYVVVNVLKKTVEVNRLDIVGMYISIILYNILYSIIQYVHNTFLNIWYFTDINTTLHKN